MCDSENISYYSYYVKPCQSKLFFEDFPLTKSQFYYTIRYGSPLNFCGKPRTIRPFFYFSLNMTKNPWWQESLSIFSRLSGWVLLPLVLGTLLGRWLDRKFDSDPKWFFIVIGVAFILSMIGLVIQAKKEMKKFSK